MRVGTGSCAWANTATALPSSAAGAAEFCNAEPVDGTALEVAPAIVAQARSTGYGVS